MEEKILQILAKYSILSQSVEDIVIKDGVVIIIIDIAVLELKKSEAEKVSKLCEVEIAKLLNFNKVDIVLTSSNASIKTRHLDKSQESSANEKVVAKNLLGQEILLVAGVKKIIAVASAKGGVGKSTLAVNLAIAMSKIGKKVALVDADIYGPSIPHLMNIDSKPNNKDGLIEPLISFGVKCISVGSLIDKNAAGVWRGPMVTKILYQLIRSVNWRFDNQDVDLMIIDMPPGTGDVYLSIAEKFPISGVVIISTPQTLATIDVARSIDCFNKLKIPIIGLIQNMSYLENQGVKQYIFGKNGALTLAQKMNIAFLGECQIAQEISDSTEARKPFMLTNSKPELLLNIGKIAEEIIDKVFNS